MRGSGCVFKGWLTQVCSLLRSRPATVDSNAVGSPIAESARRSRLYRCRIAARGVGLPQSVIPLSVAALANPPAAVCYTAYCAPIQVGGPPQAAIPLTDHRLPVYVCIYTRELP